MKSHSYLRPFSLYQGRSRCIGSSQDWCHPRLVIAALLTVIITRCTVDEEATFLDFTLILKSHFVLGITEYVVPMKWSEVCQTHGPIIDITGLDFC